MYIGCGYTQLPRQDTTNARARTHARTCAHTHTQFELVVLRHLSSSFELVHSSDGTLRCIENLRQNAWGTFRISGQNAAFRISGSCRNQHRRYVFTPTIGGLPWPQLRWQACGPLHSSIWALFNIIVPQVDLNTAVVAWRLLWKRETLPLQNSIF